MLRYENNNKAIIRTNPFDSGCLCKKNKSRNALFLRTKRGFWGNEFIFRDLNEWRMASDEWRLANGEWRVASGEWKCPGGLAEPKQGEGTMRLP